MLDFFKRSKSFSLLLCVVIWIIFMIKYLCQYNGFKKFLSMPAYFLVYYCMAMFVLVFVKDDKTKLLLSFLLAAVALAIYYLT